jgi:hypothetical protein
MFPSSQKVLSPVSQEPFRTWYFGVENFGLLLLQLAKDSFPKIRDIGTLCMRVCGFLVPF